MQDRITERFVELLRECSFIKGIVMGGSRATGTATEASDLDIGVYYDRSSIDFDRLNEIAERLDDAHRKDLICREGGWGSWVNCGGWLTVDGIHVDLILRDFERVRRCVDDCDNGIVSCNYQPGHPHAYLNVMYRGELAQSLLLHAADTHFIELKKRAEEYPDAMRNALIEFHRFEADFSCNLAKQYGTDDIYYLAGHLFRSVSALNQVLFALNRTYCLNEKKAMLRIEGLRIVPADYRARAERIMTIDLHQPERSAHELEHLCADVKSLIDFE